MSYTFTLPNYYLLLKLHNIKGNFNTLKEKKSLTLVRQKLSKISFMLKRRRKQTYVCSTYLLIRHKTYRNVEAVKNNIIGPVKKVLNS